MFLRPAVVSMDRLFRGVAHDPNRGTIAAKSAMIALTSAGLYLLNRDNPRYQDLEDWDRDSYWHFFVPTSDGDDLHFRYPKIWEVGALATLAERTVERTMDAEPVDYGKDVARVVTHQFGLNLMPQAFAPLYEQATNRHRFTGRPIETQGMENLQPFLRAGAGTSETMRALGMATRDLPESLQVNPVRAESILRGYLNTWALYGLMLSDAALFPDKAPERRFDQYPVVRRFFKDEPPTHTKHETKFYELLTESKRLVGTMRELDRMGEREIADGMEKNPRATQAKQLQRVERRLSAIHNEMAQVRMSGATPEEKRRKLDELTREKNTLVKVTVLEATSDPSR